MRSSILRASSPSSRIGQTVRRGSLEMYDLFSRVNGNGSVYMHTGQRTRPPSGGHSDVRVSVNGNTVLDKRVDHFTTLSRNAAGKDVIGYQSVKVKGKVKPGEDGTVVTYQNDMVTYQGKAEISLPEHI